MFLSISTLSWNKFLPHHPIYLPPSSKYLRNISGRNTDNALIDFRFHGILVNKNWTHVYELLSSFKAHINYMYQYTYELLWYL
jgi:hypothetical protein